MVDTSRPTSIPGVSTFHRREEWQNPLLPVNGPSPTMDEWTHLALHYTAADDLIDGDPGEHAEDLPAYLRAIQRDYETNRKYSVGYGFAVDWLGGVWEIRGFDIKHAANLHWNEETCTVLCLVDGADPLTPEALASVNAIYAEADRRAGIHLRPVGHRDIGATACPGEGIYAQIQAGAVRPLAVVEPEPPAPPPEPEPPTPEEDDDMTDLLTIWLDKTNGGENAVYLIGLGGVTHLDGKTYNRYKAAGVQEVEGVNAEVSKSYRRVARGITEA